MPPEPPPEPFPTAAPRPAGPMDGNVAGGLPEGADGHGPAPTDHTPTHDLSTSATTTGRFNRACRAVALLWLVATVPAGLYHRPTDSDFQQFYLGGLAVRTGMSDEIYPIHKPGSRDNPGMKPESDLTPTMARLRDEYRVPDITRWMLPPPSALLFVPLSMPSYMQAEWLWVFLLIGCTWGVAVLAGRVYEEIAGQPSRWVGVLALLVVLSPMACRAIRIRNDTPPIALAIGIAALALLRHDGPRAAVAIVVGALLKYATVILLPLVVATRRWRTLGWTVAVGAAFAIGSLVVMGPKPYEVFATKIAPTLNRPSGFPGNQTYTGMMSRVTKAKPLTPGVRNALVGAGAATLLVLLVLLFRQRPDDRRRPDVVFPAAAGLVAWIMVFSPVGWEHWPIFLAPFWGWLVWEARRGIVRAMLATIAIGLMSVPLSIFTNDGFLKRDLVLPEPWNSSQLWGVSLTLLLALGRLAVRPANRPSSSPTTAATPTRENGERLPPPAALARATEGSLG